MDDTMSDRNWRGFMMGANLGGQRRQCFDLRFVNAVSLYDGRSICRADVQSTIVSPNAGGTPR